MLSKVFIIASAVTVFRSVEMLMAALFMRQFNPSVPTMEATSSDAERTLCSLTTSKGVKFYSAIILLKRQDYKRDCGIMAILTTVSRCCQALLLLGVKSKSFILHMDQHSMCSGIR